MQQASLARAPQVEGRSGAVRAPAFAVAFDGERFGEFALVENEFEPFADGEVVNGQHIGSSEVEDEEHLDGPAADAFYFGKARNYFGVGQCIHFGQLGDRAGEHSRGEVADVRGFGAREPNAPQSFGVGREYILGAREIAIREQSAEAAEDCFGGASAELLIGDGAHERFEAGYDAACVLSCQRSRQIARGRDRPSGDVRKRLCSFGWDRFGRGSRGAITPKGPHCENQRQNSQTGGEEERGARHRMHKVAEQPRRDRRSQKA